MRAVDPGNFKLSWRIETPFRRDLAQPEPMSRATVIARIFGAVASHVINSYVMVEVRP